MPAATDGPTVSLSFANNFWGKDDAGVGPLLDRMSSAKQTSDELRSFYSARASIEEEYARKLMSLSKKPLGTYEMGSLKTSLDTVRGEVESIAKQHASIAAQMKSELEEPLAAFAGGMKERRKIIQNTVEKLHKTKVAQTTAVNKARDRYENDCLKIKGYLAQGHMVMGQEERKNKARLEKTQISLASSNTEYENAVKQLEETTGKWNSVWKSSADKFQDLEEERLDFTKSSLWTFANIASTVCVSDDASCEKIRLSLEKMDVENDIMHFINEKGTGQEIPDPPKYINFCRGDVDDHRSEVSDDENYSVAQFPRSINPAFRTSSPQPSTFESHHDPNSALARDLAHEPPVAAPAPLSRDPAIAAQKALVTRGAQQDRQRGSDLQQYPRSINPGFRAPSPQPSTYESHHDPNSSLARDLARRDRDPQPPAPRDLVPRNMAARDTTPRDIAPRDITPRDVVPRDIVPRSLQRSEPPPSFSREPQRNDPFSRNMQRSEPELSLSRDLQRQDIQRQELQKEREREELQRQELKRQQEAKHQQELQRQQELQQQELERQEMERQELERQELQRQQELQRYDPAPSTTRELARNEPPPLSSRDPVKTHKTTGSVSGSIMSQGGRKGSTGMQQQYDASQFAPVPHDPYPMDGMTMLCRTDGMNSGMNSATSSNLSARPSSRDDNSDYSNPTSFSSQEPPSGKVSPVKPEPEPVAAPQSERRMTKKKSGFFQNHSPFRRKSVKDIQQPVQTSNRNTWAPASRTPQASPTKIQTTQAQGTPTSRRSVFQPPQPAPAPEPQTIVPDRTERTASPDPIDANASLALNIGQNVFNVANTDRRNKAESAAPAPEEDPIALALAELKGVAGNKQAAGRISADHYHGIATPAPDRTPNISRSVPTPRASSDVAAAQRGTPPPSYDHQVTAVQRLGVPPPAVTSKAMQEASRKYAEQTRDMFSAKRPGTGVYTSGTQSSKYSRPATRGSEMPRATSPAVPRATSPRPSSYQDSRQTHRSVSPNPYSGSQTRNSPAASPSSYGGTRNSPQPASPVSPMSYGGGRQQASPQPAMSVKRGSEQGYYRQNNSSANSIRAPSPSPYRGDYSRPTSRAGEMAMQLAPIGGDGSVYGSMRGRGNGRPETSSSARGMTGAMTFYEGRDPMAETRQRSKSVADPSRQYTKDGRAILHYARALYMYQAAIPEELGFSKGETLAVLRHQDDGWWEAEIHSGEFVGRGGLVPSNYLQPL
ncbi:hypothetical protein F4806DRAFT_456135 [Annulohypoxylon nitens]|nr:hypothetical protein F4806DRAFT_456135 [Annulohypoxylon nitens]